MSLPKKIALGVAIGLGGCSGCLVLVSYGYSTGVKVERNTEALKADMDAIINTGQTPKPVEREDPEPELADYETIDTAAMIEAYENNELSADTKYKGRNIRGAGIVDDVKKGMMGGAYVIIGTGKQYALRQVQCFLVDDPAVLAEASKLGKGTPAVYVGNVSGLLMHVQVKKCMVKEIVDAESEGD